MILKRARIRNFRAIRDAEVNFGAHTAILGGNGVGKSTVLRAIERFYSPSSAIKLDDIFGRRVDETVEIYLTFGGFNEEERTRFGERIGPSDEMTVVRIFEPGAVKGSGRYYGSTLQHPAFGAIRRASNATEKRRLYIETIEKDLKYRSLASVRRADEIEPQLEIWEAAHPDESLMMRDDGQFFGFTNVGRGNLQQSTCFVFIPAVRDANADAIDARGAAVAKLMELVVRSAIQSKKEIREWQARIGEEYKDLVRPDKIHELGSLSMDLSDTLKKFYADCGVGLTWKATPEFAIPLPSAEISLDDDGFSGPVDRKGHGLQRAFVLTLLQHLAKASAAAVHDESVVGDVQPVAASPTSFVLPGLILAIEEPELYQHPTKQRHFAKVLEQISDGRISNVAANTQVMFASHSSLFVSVGRFDEIRIARRCHDSSSGHKECVLTSSTLEAVCRRLEKAFGEDLGSRTADGLRGRLHVVGPELAEGFFAELVVLVEGASDRAALIAAAALEGVDFEEHGIALLSTIGKTGLSKPAAIFQELEIPTFLIWDCDSGNRDPKVEHNRALQRLCGITEEDISDFSTRIGRNFASFEFYLEAKLKAEIGECLFSDTLDHIKAKYGFHDRADACKSPIAMTEVLAEAAAESATSGTLQKIVKAILELRRPITQPTEEVNSSSVLLPDLTGSPAAPSTAVVAGAL